MSRAVMRTVELLGLAERHILVRDQITDCVVTLPLGHIDCAPAEAPTGCFDRVVTMPRWVAAEAGIA
jgi:hypothetical protein